MPGKSRCLAQPDSFLVTVRSTSRKRAFAPMILTCPNCGTQYVVKEGAIPPGGRQVRCAACKHSWHQDPEEMVSDGEVGAPPIPEPQEEQPEPVAQEAVAQEEDESLAEAT